MTSESIAGQGFWDVPFFTNCIAFHNVFFRFTKSIACNPQVTRRCKRMEMEKNTYYWNYMQFEFDDIDRSDENDCG